MLLEDIKTGVKLKLDVYDEKGNKVQEKLISQFDHAVGENFALINAPFHEGVLYPIHIGWSLDVFFNHNDNLYMFNSRVVDRLVKDDIAYLKIEKITDITRIQRRDYFRLEYSLPIEYRKIEYEDVLKYKKSRRYGNQSFHGGVTKNISGGGICVLLNEEFEVNQFLECRLSLENDKEIIFVGRILRCNKMDNYTEYFRYEAGMVYEIIDDTDKEEIIRFIYKKQRELRNRGYI